jgi:hypothetical protein
MERVWMNFPGVSELMAKRGDADWREARLWMAEGRWLPALACAQGRCLLPEPEEP